MQLEQLASSECLAFFCMLVVRALGCLRMGLVGSGSSSESYLKNRLALLLQF